MAHIALIIRSILSLIFCVFTILYSFLILDRLKKGNAVMGRVFLREKGFMNSVRYLTIAILLVLMFNLALLSRDEVIHEVGRYLAFLSLALFFYALHTFYKVIK